MEVKGSKLRISVLLNFKAIILKNPLLTFFSEVTMNFMGVLLLLCDLLN